jgi:hypothetical protein
MPKSVLNPKNLSSNFMKLHSQSLHNGAPRPLGCMQHCEQVPLNACQHSVLIGGVECGLSRSKAYLHLFAAAARDV